MRQMTDNPIKLLYMEILDLIGSVRSNIGGKYLVQFYVVSYTKLMREYNRSGCTEMSQFMGCLSSCKECELKNYPCEVMALGESQVIFKGYMSDEQVRKVEAFKFRRGMVATGKSLYISLIKKVNYVNV